MEREKGREAWGEREREMGKRLRARKRTGGDYAPAAIWVAVLQYITAFRNTRGEK